MANIDFPLTENEKHIIKLLRSLLPYEKIEITADKGGRVNNFFVVKTTKVILTDNLPIYTH